MTTQTTHSSSLRIIFMGTPEFAVASLDALINAGNHIVAVITAPDKPAGRGMKMTENAVKKFAVNKGLKVLQPEKLKDPAFLEEFRSLHADLQIVVAFRMLPEVVWNMPTLGTVNLHGSLLPHYRGAAPINWAIINGEMQTGVTTFRLQHEIDTGNILLQKVLAIGKKETAGELHDRMKLTGAALLVDTVKGLAAGTLQETPQQVYLSSPDSGELPVIKHAPKINNDTCKIDWTKPAGDVYNLIRGLSPYPASFTFLSNKMLKVYRAHVEPLTSSVAPGEYETDKKTFIRYAAADGYISLQEVQMEGKKKMTVGEFLRGYRFE